MNCKNVDPIVAHRNLLNSFLLLLLFKLSPYLNIFKNFQKSRLNT